MTTPPNGTSVLADSFVEVKIPVPWGYIAGKWWGDLTNEPILAIHGWLDNAGTFDNLAPLLINKINKRSILCIDLPGHGLSSHIPDGNYYYLCWDGVMIIRRISNYYKWKEPITLMGHSLGGAISFLYAAIYPDDIKQYICIDIISPAVRKLSVEEIGPQLDAFLKIEKINKSVVRYGNYQKCIDTVLFAHNGSCTRSSCEILMRRGMKLIDPNILPKDSTTEPRYEFCRDLRLKYPILGFMSIDDACAYAKQIKCRILNIRALGSTGHSEINKEYYFRVLQILKETTPFFSYMEIEGTHHLHLNNPEKIQHIIKDFLQES